MRMLILMLSVLFTLSCTAQTTEKQDKEAILAVMKAQEKAWSSHDLEGFMQGYWKSDALKFYGRNGLTCGWNKTLGQLQEKTIPQKTIQVRLVSPLMIFLKSRQGLILLWEPTTSPGTSVMPTAYLWSFLKKLMDSGRSLLICPVKKLKIFADYVGLYRTKSHSGRSSHLAGI